MLAQIAALQLVERSRVVLGVKVDQRRCLYKRSEFDLYSAIHSVQVFQARHLCPGLGVNTVHTLIRAPTSSLTSQSHPPYTKHGDSMSSKYYTAVQSWV